MTSPEEQEDLLTALGAVAREEQSRVDERLVRLAEGRLSIEEATALERELGASPQGREALARFRPLDSAVTDRLRAAARAKLAPPIDGARSLEIVPSAPAATAASTESAAPRGRRRRVFVVAASALAAMAASLLLLVRPVEAPLPKFTVAAVGGERAERGDWLPAEPRRLGPGSRLSVVLTPATAVTGDVDARVFAVRGRQAVALPVIPERTAAGAVRIAGTTEELGLTALGVGPAVLVVAVGRPAALPEATELATTAARPGVLELHRVAVEVVARDAPPRP